MYPNKQPANWIKQVNKNGMTYHLSDKGAVKITTPDGKVVAIMSGHSAAILGDHIDGFSEFCNNEVKEFLVSLESKRNDEKIVKSLQKRVERTAADLEVLAKLNPELVQAILKKASGQ